MRRNAQSAFFQRPISGAFTFAACKKITNSPRIEATETTPNAAAEATAQNTSEATEKLPKWAEVFASLSMHRSAAFRMGVLLDTSPEVSELQNFLKTRLNPSGRWTEKQAKKARKMLAAISGASPSQSIDFERVTQPKKRPKRSASPDVLAEKMNLEKTVSSGRFGHQIESKSEPKPTTQNAPFSTAETEAETRLFEAQKDAPSATHSATEKPLFRFDELAFINAALVGAGCLSMGLAMGFFGAFISLPMAAIVIWTIRHGGDLAKHGSYSLAFFTSVLVEIFFAGSHFQNIREAVEGADHLPFGRDVYAAALCVFTFFFSLFTLSIRRKAAIDDAFNPAA